MCVCQQFVNKLITIKFNHERYGKALAWTVDLCMRASCINFIAFSFSHRSCDWFEHHQQKQRVRFFFCGTRFIADDVLIMCLSASACVLSVSLKVYGIIFNPEEKNADLIRLEYFMWHPWWKSKKSWHEDRRNQKANIFSWEISSAHQQNEMMQKIKI